MRLSACAEGGKREKDRHHDGHGGETVEKIVCGISKKC
jgi:hypothetical protein